jgi:hypothetical protein
VKTETNVLVGLDKDPTRRVSLNLVGIVVMALMSFKDCKSRVLASVTGVSGWHLIIQQM